MIDDLVFGYTFFGIFYLMITAMGLLMAQDVHRESATTNWARALLALPIWPLTVVWGIGYLVWQVIVMAEIGRKK